MIITLSADALREIAQRASLETDGDPYERRYAYIVLRYLPNYQQFWRGFILPLTNRIVPSITDPIERIRFRSGLSPEVKRVATSHYTVFTKAIYAYRHLSHFTPECLRDYTASSFEDFYTHLASLCDLMEDFLSGLAVLLNGEVGLERFCSLETLTTMLHGWYDKNATRIYDWYTKKKKPIILPNRFRQSLLDEYYGRDCHEWVEYKRVSQLFREYRNYIVHNVHIGKVFLYVAGMPASAVWYHFSDAENGRTDSFPLVPTKEAFRKYPTWDDVLNLTHRDDEKIKTDFVDMKVLMDRDYLALLSTVNKLWERPIRDWQTAVKVNPAVQEHAQLKVADLVPPDSLSVERRSPHGNAGENPWAHMSTPAPMGSGSGRYYVPDALVTQSPTMPGVSLTKVSVSPDGLPSIIIAQFYNGKDLTPAKTVELQYKDGTWIGDRIQLAKDQVTIDGVVYPFQFEIPLDVSVWHGET